MYYYAMPRHITVWHTTYLPQSVIHVTPKGRFQVQLDPDLSLLTVLIAGCWFKLVTGSQDLLPRNTASRTATRAGSETSGLGSHSLQVHIQRETDP